MINTNRIAEIGLLVGEPARVAMLYALMDGRALTAAELAHCANVTPQTASSHLARLTMTKLLKVEKQGRHRYHRLASTEIARLLEGIMEIAAQTTLPVHKPVVGPRDTAMRRARTCYDHLAGRLGVALADVLIKKGAVAFDDEAGLLSKKGVRILSGLGVEIGDANQSQRAAARPLCRPCLDWSERRPHLAGALGAAICAHFLERKYVRRIDGTRALDITRAGEHALRNKWGIGAI